MAWDGATLKKYFPATSPKEEHINLVSRAKSAALKTYIQVILYGLNRLYFNCCIYIYIYIYTYIYTYTHTHTHTHTYIHTHIHTYMNEMET
jgi:hypothetical protein